jgi:anti-sigma factor RsiW
MNCPDVEAQLAGLVDGDGSVAGAPLAAHLDTCAACRALAHAQLAARAVIKARAAQLSPVAPPGLRTRIAAAVADRPAPRARAWPVRLSAFAAAAIVVLAVAGALLPLATIRSTTLLAAQLALDHMKCFVIDGDGGAAPIGKADAEATLQRDYGFTMSVPASLAAEGLDLVAVRRCLYGDGLAAHVMYRVNGEPLSLFIMPGLARPAADLRVLGHDEMVWTEGNRTYMLVARGGSAGMLSRVAPYIRNEAK